MKREGVEDMAFPINTIALLKFENGATVYNPTITYLPKPDFPPGCDKNIVTAIYERISEMPQNVKIIITIGTKTRLMLNNYIYFNQYGLIVMADQNGQNPFFIPVTYITGIGYITA